MARASFTILAHDRDGQPVDIGWRTPHMPMVGETIFLPDRQADARHPWMAMVVVGVGHFPSRTEVALSPPDDVDDERLTDVYAEASAHAAEAFAD